MRTILLIAIALAGWQSSPAPDGAPRPTPSPTATPSPSPRQSPTPTPSPTVTPDVTAPPPAQTQAEQVLEQQGDDQPPKGRSRHHLRT
jgi:hypothetical protein